MNHAYAGKFYVAAFVDNIGLLLSLRRGHYAALRGRIGEREVVFGSCFGYERCHGYEQFVVGTELYLVIGRWQSARLRAAEVLEVGQRRFGSAT